MDSKYYDVEKIVDKKINSSGKEMYLVKWAGYSSKDNTWEPLDNLQNVRHMIEEFEQEQKEIGKNYTKTGSIYADTPKEIVDIQILNDKLYMQVKWKKRRSNVQPENSLVLYPELKKNYPLVVLEYFESNLRIGKHPIKFKNDHNEFTFQLKKDDESK